MPEETAVVLPPGVRVERPTHGQLDRGMVVNETDLPDHLVIQAVETFMEERASVFGASAGSSLMPFEGANGSLLAKRGQLRVPRNPIEEIILARDLAERDDDVRATMGAIVATCYEQDLRHAHADDAVIGVFDEVRKHTDLMGAFAEMHREWLIASQITTACLWTRETFQFTPPGSDRQRSRDLVSPLIGTLPSEQIRVIGNDLWRTAQLAYKPATATQDTWLKEYFAPTTSAARKAEMRQKDPVLTTLLTGQLQEEDDTFAVFSWEQQDMNTANTLYGLNPRMVARTTAAKGAWKYPRPLMTSNLPLLEAKRLLNIMDYALLQGGANFLVVAKKGSDQRPAMPEEVENLREVVKRSSHTGVMVGDHRLNIDIITPDLKELLNPTKRNLLGRRLAQALLRVPDFAAEDSGGQAVLAAVEILTRVLAHDRGTITRHIVDKIYDEVVTRNSTLTSPARILWPRIVLQGTQWFTDYVLKMRDRGDISRRSAVEAGGFDYDAEVESRKREKAAGDDRVMTPAAVPFSSPNQGAKPGADPTDPYKYPSSGAPNDNGGGRPRGSGPNNGAPGAQRRAAAANVRPTRVIQRNAGETVRAMYDEEHGTYRAGELTHAILEEYPDREIGRITPGERDALEAIAGGSFEPFRAGPLTIVPVNGAEQLDDVRAVRLSPGLSMLIGQRTDDEALMARAFSFREPEYDPLAAQETALRWGYETDVADEPQAPDSSREEHAADVVPLEPRGELAPVIHLHVETGAGGKVRRTVLRDKDGNITGTEEEPVDELGFGKTEPGKYIYIKCPECGLVQDAADAKCKRCGHDLTEVRKAMFASYEQKGEKPPMHTSPPPPASEQPDRRKGS